MTFSWTPTVSHSLSPSLVSTSTRVTAPVPSRPLQDADLVVDQLEPVQLGEGLCQRRAQRLVQRVDRTVALAGGDDPLSPRVHLHGGLAA